MLNTILALLLMFNLNIYPQAEEISSAVDKIDTEELQKQQSANEIKMFDEYEKIVKDTSKDGIEIIQENIQKMQDEATTKILKLIFMILKYLMLIILINFLILYGRSKQ